MTARLATAIVRVEANRYARRSTMAPILIPDDELEDAFDESLLVHARRVERLLRRGPMPIVHPEQNNEISTLAQGSADIVRRLGEQPIIEAGAVPRYGPIFNA